MCPGMCVRMSVCEGVVLAFKCRNHDDPRWAVVVGSFLQKLVFCKQTFVVLETVTAPDRKNT